MRFILTLLASLLATVAAAQQLPMPQFRTPADNDNSPRAATTAYVRDLLKKRGIRNVLDYASTGQPFDQTGAVDSTAAIQAAIDDLPATGGIVQVPCGSRIRLTDTLQVHNGSASSYTTRNGTRIEGQCATPGSWSFSGALPPSSVPSSSVHFLWYGAANKPMVQVNGGDGWGLDNLVLDCRDTAGSIGLKVVSASTGRSGRLAALNCRGAGLLSTTVPGINVGGTVYKGDSLRNEYQLVYVLLADGGRGVVLDGARGTSGAFVTNTDFNRIVTLQIQDKGVNGSTPAGLVFGVADSNIVENLQCTLTNSSSTCINYDVPTGYGGVFPGSNLVNMADWGGIPTNPVTVTGADLQAFNFITNVLHVNGGDTRVNLHPKIFMTDGSVSITAGRILPKEVSQLTDGYLSANLYQENGQWKYFGNGMGLVHAFPSTGGFFRSYVAGINSSGAGFDASLSEYMRIYPGGFIEYVTDTKMNTTRLTVHTVAGLPTCSSAAAGQLAMVGNANAPAWNQPLTGGGSVSVGARCNGTTWVAY